MKFKTVRRFVLIGLLFSGACLFLMSRYGFVLELANRDRLHTIWIAVSASERFSISHVNSIYDALVTEDFQIEGQSIIVLTGVRTKSHGVMEYYGFADGKEYHPMHVPLGNIVMRVGLGAGQELIVGKRRLFLRELGEWGDRVQLKIVPITRGFYLISKLSGKLL